MAADHAHRVARQANHALAVHVVYHELYPAPVVGAVEHHYVVVCYRSQAASAEAVQRAAFLVEVEVGVYPRAHQQLVHPHLVARHERRPHRIRRDDELVRHKRAPQQVQAVKAEH